MTRTRLPCWTVPVTVTLDKLLEQAVRKDTHVSKSDLIREAVREKLAYMGFSYSENRGKQPRSIRSVPGSPRSNGAEKRNENGDDVEAR